MNVLAPVIMVIVGVLIALFMAAYIVYEVVSIVKMVRHRAAQLKENELGQLPAKNESIQ